MKVKNATVVVLKPITGATDSEGLPIRTWEKVATLKGTLIPYGDEGDYVQIEPGFVSVRYYKFFYKGSNEFLVEGNNLKLEDGAIYSILKVLDYNRVMEIRIGGTGE